MAEARERDGDAGPEPFELRTWKALPKPPGRMVGPYEIVSRGGVGRGILAQDTRTGRTVELRPLPWTGHEGEESGLHLERELERAAAIDHPHVVRLLDVAQAEGLVYAVWEHTRGRPLDGILIEMRGLGGFPSALHLGLLCGADETPPAGTDADLVLRYARLAAGRIAGAAQGIAAAHALGVLHAGIRPRNLLLEVDGRLRVAEIGVAGLLWHPEPEPGEESVWYRPPECLRGEPPGPPADVFALAAVLYEILTLQPAFPSRPGDRSLRHIEGRPPARPSLLVPGLPAEIESIVSRGMDPQASRRPSSDIFARALSSFAEGTPSTHPPVAHRPPKPPALAPSRRVRMGRLSFPLVGACAAVGLILIALFLALAGVFRSSAPALARSSIIEGAAWLWTEPLDLFEPRPTAIEPSRRLLSLALAAEARLSEDSAYACFQRAVNLWPSCAEGWFLLGLACEGREGENPEMYLERAHSLDRQLGVSAVRLDPARGDAFPSDRSWLEAVDALRAQDPERARHAAGAALAAGIASPALEICARMVSSRSSAALGDDEGAASSLSEIVRRIRVASGDASPAIEMVEILLASFRDRGSPPDLRSLDLERASPAVLLRASRLLFAAGDASGAERTAGRAARADPEGQGWFLAATFTAGAHLDAGRTEEASKVLRTAAGDRRESWEGALLSAAASILAGAPGNAAASLEDVARKVQDPLIRDLARAEALLLRAPADEAADAFHRVLDARPPILPALLAATGVRAARPADASRALGIASRAFPASAWIAREWAGALRSAAPAGEALKAYEALIRRIPPSEVEGVIGEIAPWLSAEVPADAAVAFLQDAIRRRPSRITFDVLIEIAEKAKGLSDLARFVEDELARPENIGVAEYPFQLGRIEEKLGRIERALERIDQALRLGSGDPVIAEARDRLRARLERR